MAKKQAGQRLISRLVFLLLALVYVDRLFRSQGILSLYSRTLRLRPRVIQFGIKNSQITGRPQLTTTVGTRISLKPVIRQMVVSQGLPVVTIQLTDH